MVRISDLFVIVVLFAIIVIFMFVIGSLVLIMLFFMEDFMFILL